MKQCRLKRMRGILGIELLIHVFKEEANGDKGFHLLLVGIPDFIIGLELSRVSSLGPNLLTGQTGGTVI